jgi:hypothetical protein
MRWHPTVNIVELTFGPFRFLTALQTVNNAEFVMVEGGTISAACARTQVELAILRNRCHGRRTRLERAACERGLARIYGTRTPLPDGRDSRRYLALLHELENERGRRSRVHGAKCIDDLWAPAGPSQSAENKCLSAEDHKAEDAGNRRITTPFRRGIQWRSYRLADRSSTTT